ncbi:MAG: 5-(carboxyamino)imidazole ribonucleotide synthase [Gammaproteobacteria bacterium]|nr:5-(carboxyamino)imidazole ribonucleotide synthase [Gammaproteobacteria bacterium]
MEAPILPGSTLGILGGGQLGRMFCIAARNMGYQLNVLDPDPDSPAGLLADDHVTADYTDAEALDYMARTCDVITTEFENIPAASMRRLAQKRPVHPSAEVLEIAQNRNREKAFASRAGLVPAPNHPVFDETDIERAIKVTGLPAVLKTATLGYDGKGQHVVESLEQARQAFRDAGSVECVLEKKIELDKEVSVIVARNQHGETAVYPVGENEHRKGILHLTIVPARVDKALSERARQQALQLVEELDYVGVLAVEFFIDVNNELLFNEMAPRPHNSGHYTKDACVTSQFEQLARVVCGLPPGDTALLSPVVMVNLLGELWQPDWRLLLQEPGVKLHLYGKKEARAGRKMGHFNVLDPDIERALATANRLFSSLAAD